MKKVLMFLCLVFALFGCEKVEEMKEEQWEENSVGQRNFGYKMDDPSGFGRHPLIDKLSDSTQIVIKEGLVLEYNPTFLEDNFNNHRSIKLLYQSNFKEEAERLLQEIINYESTISSSIFKEGDSFDWLSGVKNGKGWIGKADSKTRKVINEWTDGKEVEQDIKVDLGYGNYKTMHVDRLTIRNVVNIGNDYFVTTVRYNNDINYEGSVWYNLYVLSDNKTVTIPLKHYVDGDCSIIPWYKNSFLVSQDGQTSSCYSLDGKLIDTFKNTSYSDAFPCSYSDYINISGSRIARTTLIKEYPNNVWYSYYEPLSKIPSDSRVTYTLLSSTTDIWEFKADVLNYDGSKKSLKFKVNIKTGEVTD